MIALIDQYFVDRMSLITLDQVAMEVYAPGASRPKKKTALPCSSISRILGPYPDLKASRPQIDVFTPSEEQRTITIPEYQPGAGEYTGPASWTWKKCPTSVEIVYQVDLEAAYQEHMNGMLLMINEALPVPIQVEINGKKVRIYPEGHPTNLDELEAPLFRTAFRYLVTNVWVDRLAEVMKPSIAEIDMGFGVQE